MKFKQFLNEEKNATPQEMKKYNNFFSKLDIKVHYVPSNETFATHYGINDDKNALFYFSNTDFYSIGSKVDITKSKLFFKGDGRYIRDTYSYEIIGSKIKEMENNLNVNFKFLSQYSPKEAKERLTLSGVPVAFKINTSKYVKQINFT